MNNEYLNKWIMYHEIHRLDRMGFSAARIARHLVIDPRTARKYLKMSEEQYEVHLMPAERQKILSPFENFVFEKLDKYPETSAAQIHDWLKEHYPDLPEVSSRTVYNFVMFVRQKHNIPYDPATRDYFPVIEHPWGHQAQVDFGQYNMRTSDGRRKKVYVFAMVLSRSRMKFIWFTDAPFTTRDVIYAHEKAFMFFKGIPQVIVYDQDRTIIVDENLGKIILTTLFRQYTRSRRFELHFCRKSDPQSKGKIENVIQYIKKNFLLNRVYQDIETLNAQGLEWLSRTANYLPHNYTKTAPQEAFLEENKHLIPYTPLAMENPPEIKKYNLRKTNVIAYKSNFYTLPEGTYKGPGSFVLVRSDKGKLLIYDKDEQLITTHVISKEKGKTIINTNHKRDTSKSIDEMAQQILPYFSNRQLIEDYLRKIRQLYPRYTRDHFQAILKALETTGRETCDKTLAFCIKNEIFHGSEFKQVVHILHVENQENKMQGPIKLLNGTNVLKTDHMPETSKIDDYEKYINQ